MLNSGQRVTETECEGPNSLVVQSRNFASTEIWLYTRTYKQLAASFCEYSQMQNRNNNFVRLAQVTNMF